MKIKMLPDLPKSEKNVGGIQTIVKEYRRLFPEFGITHTDGDDYDLLVIHAGTKDRVPGDRPMVAMCHGLYWTGDYHAQQWEWRANQFVINTLRVASKMTVPSQWVAENIARNMRRVPIIIPHGVNWQEWQHSEQDEGYILAYAKNRAYFDVCDPTFLVSLATTFPNHKFLTTFSPPGAPRNVVEIGVQPYDEMRKIIQRASVVISPIKETFGILTLEAMAAGKPMLGFAEGGNSDLIEHGQTGYLAQPGNMTDLADGLAYCLKYKQTLGENGREISQSYTWRNAVQKVAKVYQDALHKSGDHSVGVVIPVYNKPSEQIERALKSVVSQSLTPDKIVVVDDGSQNGDMIKALAEKYGARYIRQDNSGVAVARNTGVYSLGTKYACCLDADDWIEPQFLRVCVQALELDSELHLAYTRLAWTKPDGTTGISEWPGEWNYDDQLRRKNQVPTCNVYRRETFEALGGYKSRYCPTGAGSEDAELWTRFGAYGFKCSLVTEKPYFQYSWGGGHTSQQGYSEADWLALHPWVNDSKHPFASYATPANGFSHPVYQHDTPVVSVIIPVGPGHESKIENALDSLESQTFRKWEAVVVWDTEQNEITRRVEKAYPYIRFFKTEKPLSGAGLARNLGARNARGKLVVFLDADDHLLPNALQSMIGLWNREQKIVYSGYRCIAYADDPQELARQVHADPNRKLIGYHKQAVVYDQRVGEYDCARAISQPPPAGQEPYLWCLVTTMLPLTWHHAIGGFDESMLSFEDVDYYWRLAKAGRCFTLIPDPLVVYRFHTGNRRNTGLQNQATLLQYLREKHSEVSHMGCGCKGKQEDDERTIVRIVSGQQGTAVMHVFTTKTGKKLQVTDADLIQAKYLDPRQGAHIVIGSQTGINYGRRSGGANFLVHRNDVFIEYQGRRISSTQFQPMAESVVVEEPMPQAPPPPKVSQPVSQPQRDVLVPTTASPIKAPDAPTPIETKNVSEEAFDLTTINGIGRSTAEKLQKAGVRTLTDLIVFGEARLKAMRGISDETAQSIIAQAIELSSS